MWDGGGMDARPADSQNSGNYDLVIDMLEILCLINTSILTKVGATARRLGGGASTYHFNFEVNSFHATPNAHSHSVKRQKYCGGPIPVPPLPPPIVLTFGRDGPFHPTLDP